MAYRIGSSRAAVTPSVTGNVGSWGNLANTSSKDMAALRRRRDLVGYVLFVVNMIGITVFQKISVGAMMPVALPLMLLSAAAAAIFVRPILDPMRGALYVGWLFFAALSTTSQQDGYSGASIALFIVMYLPMLVAYPISEAAYRRCLNTFSTTMLVIGGIVIAQHALQVSSSYRAWPNLDLMLPQGMLVPDFQYLQKIVWGSKYMKPNAIFFLEVSLVSQFLAIAVAIELLVFRRIWRVVYLVGVLFATFAGTGILLLVLTLPVLLRRMSVRNGAFVVALFVALVFIAIHFGWLDMVSDRLGETNKSGSSGNLRFVEPLNRITEFVQNPSAIYQGIGPGHMEKKGYQWWPLTKAIVEYGVLTGLAFYAFYLYAMLKRAPIKEFAFFLVVWYSIEGALLTTLNMVVCVIFISGFVVESEPIKRNRQRRRRSSTESPAQAEPAAFEPVPAR